MCAAACGNVKRPVPWHLNCKPRMLGPDGLATLAASATFLGSGIENGVTAPQAINVRQNRNRVEDQ